MKFRSYGFLLLGAVVLMSSGCSKVKFYAVDRPRVDQANMGNAGYVSGEKVSDTAQEGRPTRRIYVFEIDRKKKEEAAAVAKAMENSPQAVQTTEDNKRTENPPKQGLSLPYIGDDEPSADQSASASSMEVSGTLYTVVKDDTLQKISKKVYGSYSKWTKIYDANKDRIKNPNFVKPGIVIVIPQVD